ncbi:MAG: FeoB small GTPase domain-containing protein, partial [Pseudobdellovibrionaceae bacterium]
MHLDSNSVRSPSVALVGAPNSGKTTLYNWLTGSHFKTVNYPGATVEYSVGKLAPHLRSEKIDSEDSLLVMDTPGTYSLHPKSADEEVTLKALYATPELGRIDSIIVVVDGTQLGRHLQLVQQVKETGFPFVVVLTMADLLRKQNINISLSLLEKEFHCPVIPFEGLLGGGLREIVSAVRGLKPVSEVQKPVFWDAKTREKKIQESQNLASRALNQSTAEIAERVQGLVKNTRRLDQFLLHPVLGLILFLLIMGTLFTSIFWLAKPLMDGVDGVFSALANAVHSLDKQALWTDFLAHGIVASFGAVLVFVPQIFILFFGIGILESTGYLSRAATLIDKPFSLLGMS